MSDPDRLVVVTLPSLAVDSHTPVPELPCLPSTADSQVKRTSGCFGDRLIAPSVSIRSDL